MQLCQDAVKSDSLFFIIQSLKLGVLKKLQIMKLMDPNKEYTTNL